MSCFKLKGVGASFNQQLPVEISRQHSSGLYFALRSVFVSMLIKQRAIIFHGVFPAFSACCFQFLLSSHDQAAHTKTDINKVLNSDRRHPRRGGGGLPYETDGDTDMFIWSLIQVHRLFPNK